MAAETALQAFFPEALSLRLALASALVLDGVALFKHWKRKDGVMRRISLP